MSDVVSKIVSYVKSLKPAWRIACLVVAAAIAVIYFFSSCGVTRTTVRTNGKGTTNATISVTTNNPTSVSVETKLDSTKLQINKSSKYGN